MEKKINIAELLKGCPKGMELDCTMYEDVYFDCIDQEDNFIKCYIQNNDHKTSIYFTEYGHYNGIEKSKCVIYPKGKTTWEGFQRPFKDGDVLVEGSCIFIIQKLGDNGTAAKTYCTLYGDGDFYNGSILNFDIDNTKFAIEEEKQKLFDAIKANGYKWNNETKTLEKLIEPKFKVGDKIKLKNTPTNNILTVMKINDDGSLYVNMYPWVIKYELQGDYELVPNKFDITTLMPFDKVLVRDINDEYWNIGFFSCKGDKHFCTERGYYAQCIPYEGNEHLLNTTGECDDFYKTWE